MDIVLYCDLDGVLADFETGFINYYNKIMDESKVYKKLDDLISSIGEKEFYQVLNSAPSDFWSGLEFYKNGKSIWSKIKHYNPIILSSPAKSEFSVNGKIEWIENHLGKDVRYIINSEKQNYVKDNYLLLDYEIGKPKVLIDDYKVNITKWESAGGFGILHRVVGESLDMLDEVLKQ